MADIVERLRREALFCENARSHYSPPLVDTDLVLEAADLIARQREEIGRLRKALGAFVAYHDRLAGMSVDELLLGDGTSEPELRKNGHTALSDTTREE